MVGCCWPSGLSYPQAAPLTCVTCSCAAAEAADSAVWPGRRPAVQKVKEMKAKVKLEAVRGWDAGSLDCCGTAMLPTCPETVLAHLGYLTVRWWVKCLALQCFPPPRRSWAGPWSQRGWSSVRHISISHCWESRYLPRRYICHNTRKNLICARHWSGTFVGLEKSRKNWLCPPSQKTSSMNAQVCNQGF